MSFRLHICREPLQPATRCVDNHSGEPIDISYAPEDMLWVSCCHRVQPAFACVIQCRYDGAIIWCAPGHGCKDPQVVAAKRALAFANRSAGQKARWARKS